jgi:hypothetical protein
MFERNRRTLGRAAQFRFHSKRGNLERKQFRLEPRKISSETGAPWGAPLIVVFIPNGET